MPPQWPLDHLVPPVLVSSLQRSPGIVTAAVPPDAVVPSSTLLELVWAAEVSMKSTRVMKVTRQVARRSLTRCSATCACCKEEKGQKRNERMDNGLLCGVPRLQQGSRSTSVRSLRRFRLSGACGA